MATPVPPSMSKKLCITYRVEPGCLGPEGMSHVEGFCQFAQAAFDPLHAELVTWVITPRYDKALPEIQYTLVNKTLTEAQVAKYLALFDCSLDEIEEPLGDLLADLINQFFKR